MRNNHDSNRSVNDQVDDLNSGFCRGAEAMGAVIGRNPRQTHLLSRGKIKSATFAPSRPPTGVELLWSAVNGDVA
jgi:hypothetical protein